MLKSYIYQLLQTLISPQPKVEISDTQCYTNLTGLRTPLG